MYDESLGDYEFSLGQRNFHLATYPDTNYDSSKGEYYVGQRKVNILDEDMNWAGNFGRLIDGVTAIVEGRTYIPNLSVNQVYNRMRVEIESGIYGDDQILMMRVLESMLEKVSKSLVIPHKEEIISRGKSREVGTD